MTHGPTASKEPASATLGQRIRSARQDAGLSQGQLAGALQASESAVALYEAGQRAVGIDMVVSIARILHRPLQYFLGDDGGTVSVKESAIASLIADVEEQPENLADFVVYWQFLRGSRPMGEQTQAWLDLIAEAATIFGSVDEAVAWLGAPNRSIGNATPASLCEKGLDGIAEARGILIRLEEGIYS